MEPRIARVATSFCAAKETTIMSFIVFRTAHSLSLPHHSRVGSVYAGLLYAALLPSVAQASADAREHQAALPGPRIDLRQCQATPDDRERLACFDRLASQHSTGSAQPTTTTDWRAPPASLSATNGSPAPVPTAVQAATPSAPEVATTPATALAESSGPIVRGCNNPNYSPWNRFWELTEATDCDTFSLRGYRPNSVSLVNGDRVNRSPQSPSPDHQTKSPTDYSLTEGRINISVRTKVLSGLLAKSPERRDSIWFGYSQQSYWQIFTESLSRPFRSTDHEPEVMYVYPILKALPGGWNWSYGGIGAVHQSNGQSLPLSRSWNRIYLMAGFEKGDKYVVNARIWKRVSESAEADDNPGISSYIGRAEVQGIWNVNKDHTLSATVRHSLDSHGRGSVRLEWFRTLGKGLAGGRSNLRLHTQIFSGYGDTLLDYNYKRTVFSVGLSLLDL
jgi:phospholipase A1